MISLYILFNLLHKNALQVGKHIVMHTFKFFMPFADTDITFGVQDIRDDVVDLATEVI